jgi:hypothetical protein
MINKQPYTLEIRFDARFADKIDRSNAEQAIYDAMALHGADTAEKARALLADLDTCVTIYDAGSSALKAGDGYVSDITVHG